MQHSRTSAKHLASSSSPERLTKSDAGMIAQAPCVRAAADYLPHHHIRNPMRPLPATPPLNTPKPEKSLLALLTALVSVIATGAPTVSQLFQGYNSKLLVQFQGDDRSGGVVILASNVGNQPGVIKEARLIMPTKGAATPAQVALINSDSSFILPGKQARLRLVFDIRKQYTGSDFSGKCILLVTAMEFLGKHKVIEFPVSCDELSVVVGAQQST